MPYIREDHQNVKFPLDTPGREAYAEGVMKKTMKPNPEIQRRLRLKDLALTGDAPYADRFLIEQPEVEELGVDLPPEKAPE